MNISRINPGRIGTGVMKVKLWLQVSPTTKLFGTTEKVEIVIPYWIVSPKLLLT